MTVHDRVAEIDEELLLADGYDDCVIGIAYEAGRPSRVAYDRSGVIQSLMKEMTWEDAEEFFEFNIVGAYVGERTPVFIEAFK